MILVYLENAQEKLPKNTLATIGAALAAKAKFAQDKVVGLVIGGTDADKAASEASQYGLDEVLLVQDGSLDNYLAVPYADVFASCCSELSPTFIMLPSTTRGRDLAPRIAQQLDITQVSEIIDFTGDGSAPKFKRPMYAGNVIATVSSETPRVLLTVRPSAFAAATKGGSCSVRKLAISANPANAGKQEFVGFETVKSERPELTEASIIVSGGRAMKSAENFQQFIAPLADSLGAAIGASRAAVDSGYAPNDWQVGQTGKVVSPSLYVAVGISGAIQHLAGMKDSKVIVAINKDPEAPIFEVADYGLVADLFEVVPPLTEEIKKARGA